MNDPNKRAPSPSEQELRDSQEEVLAKLKIYLNDERQASDTLPAHVKRAQTLLELFVQKGQLAGEIKRLRFLKGLYLFCVGGRLIDASAAHSVQVQDRCEVKIELPGYCVDFAASHYTLRPLSETIEEIDGMITRHPKGMTDQELSYYTSRYLGLYPVELWEEGIAGEGYCQYTPRFEPTIPPFIYVRLPRWSSDLAAKYPRAIFQAWFPGHNAKHAFATLGGTPVEQVSDILHNSLEKVGIVRVFVAS